MSAIALSLSGKSRTAALTGLLVLAMSGLGYASVPLYRMFCQATGYAGTTQRAEGKSAPGAVAGKTISIRFDANHVPALKWTFAPEVPTQIVTIGARNMAFFDAENLTDHAITGQASYNVMPDVAGMYFTKIQCFCFTKQTLKPHEKVRMPVIFYVDPKILGDDTAKDVPEITLSYTFYPVDLPQKAS
jgi:cytochrome c oxidase assembly protein subunit 11